MWTIYSAYICFPPTAQKRNQPNYINSEATVAYLRRGPLIFAAESFLYTAYNVIM
jgi:hypothetical protein